MANNNIFNMNVEFGLNKDENIANTTMGIAVKNGDSWRIYDKKKQEITDLGNMQLGNFTSFIIPVTELTEGDLIKDAGEYYFVNKVQEGSTQTLCAKTGEIKTVIPIIPIKDDLEFSCYSKVIAFSDSLNIRDMKILAVVSAMFGQSVMNQFMLLKDKLGRADNAMKFELIYSMISSMSGDIMAASNNPLMGYLLIDAFMGLRQETDEETAE